MFRCLITLAVATIAGLTAGHSPGRVYSQEGPATALRDDVAGASLRTSRGRGISWWDREIALPLRREVEALPVNAELVALAALDAAEEVAAMTWDADQVQEPFARFNSAERRSFVEAHWGEPRLAEELPTSDRATERFRHHVDQQRERASGPVRTDGSRDREGEIRPVSAVAPAVRGLDGELLRLNIAQPVSDGDGEVRVAVRRVRVEWALGKDEEGPRSLRARLLAAHEAYWELYRARAVLLQNCRSLQRLSEIESRIGGADSARGRLVSEAIASRRAAALAALVEVEEAERQIRLLSGETTPPDLAPELVPEEIPLETNVVLDRAEIVQMALVRRPEIGAAIHELRRASHEAGIAEEEILPSLDFVVQTYVRGIQETHGAPETFIDPFSRGRPSYSLGLHVEVPLRTRSTEARQRRARFNYQSAVKRFRDEMDAAAFDADEAIAAVVATTRRVEECSRQVEQLAFKTDEARVSGSDLAAFGEDLERERELVAAETALAEARVEVVLALVDLRRVCGTLLEPVPPPADERRPSVRSGRSAEGAESLPVGFRFEQR